MDVHMVNPLNNLNTNSNVLRPRSKEEKEAMDHLSSIVSIFQIKFHNIFFIIDFIYLVFSIKSKNFQRNIFFYNCLFC